MTAEQTRQRNPLTTILSAALGVLALSALLILLNPPDPASASHWECWNPGNCYQPAHPPPTAAPTTINLDPPGTLKPPSRPQPPPPAQEDSTNHNDDGTCAPRCDSPSDLGQGGNNNGGGGTETETETTTATTTATTQAPIIVTTTQAPIIVTTTQAPIIVTTTRAPITGGGNGGRRRGRQWRRR